MQSYYYDRDDVALPGMAKFFKKNSDEEREHAQKFMKVSNSSVLVYLKKKKLFLVST